MKARTVPRNLKAYRPAGRQAGVAGVLRPGEGRTCESIPRGSSKSNNEYSFFAPSTWKRGAQPSGHAARSCHLLRRLPRDWRPRHHSGDLLPLSAGSCQYNLRTGCKKLSVQLSVGWCRFCSSGKRLRRQDRSISRHRCKETPQFQEFREAPQDCRTINWHPNNTSRGGKSGLAILSNITASAARPMSRQGWCWVVRGTGSRRAYLTSSIPTIRMSDGMPFPERSGCA